MVVYENFGTASNPALVIFADTLFDVVGNYIDGTDFALVDIDSDGDQDLFTGVWYSGEIKYYQTSVIRRSMPTPW